MKAEEVLPLVDTWSVLAKLSSWSRLPGQPIIVTMPMPTQGSRQLGAPSAKSGHSIMVPLLSWLKTRTGFTNCLAVDTAATTNHPSLAKEHAYTFQDGRGRPGLPRNTTRSLAKAAIPMMPLVQRMACCSVPDNRLARIG